MYRWEVDLLVEMVDDYVARLPVRIPSSRIALLNQLRKKVVALAVDEGSRDEPKST